MSAMTAMFAQAFAAIAMFFAGFEKLAKAFTNLATVAEQSSEAYADTSSIERQINLAQRKHELLMKQKQLTISE